MADGGILQGRRALVTGAGIGLGAGIAAEFARQGAAVVFHYASNGRNAQQAVERVCAGGGVAFAEQADLTQVSECRRLVDIAIERLGGLDILVNNAGMTRRLAFGDTPPEVLDNLFNLNVRGYFFCAQQAGRWMAGHGGGTILCLSSVHAFAGLPGFSVYGATKAAIVALARQLAQELIGYHVRVNVIAPGHIEVERHLADANYTRELGNQRVPWGRVGLPEDIARIATFLASDAADFVTGQVLYVDGGLTSKLALL